MNKYQVFKTILKLHMLQNSRIVMSDSSVLKPPIKIKFSYLAKSESIAFPMLYTCVPIKLLWGLQEQHETHFFFLKFSSRKSPSQFEKSVGIDLEGLTSRI